MNDSPSTPARGPSLPALGFMLALVVLAALALLTLRARPTILTGPPEGPLGERVQAALEHHLPIDTEGLRLQGALLGEQDESSEPPSTEAQSVVRAASEERPRDPRLRVAQGLMELALHRHEAAERCYRQALDVAPTYGEARLGLGVTLALRAAGEEDEGRAHGLRLRAISQLAAVPDGDPCREAALYDRVLLLMKVGRKEEAWRWARAYLARDPNSPWSLVLEREVPEP